MQVGGSGKGAVVCAGPWANPYNGRRRQKLTKKALTCHPLLKRKAPTRSRGTPSISPLLAAVAKRTAIPPALRDRILLRCYIALDALNRSKASQELFVMLGQLVLMAEALTALGYSPEAKPHLLLARTSLIKVHERAADSA